MHLFNHPRNLILLIKHYFLNIGFIKMEYENKVII